MEAICLQDKEECTPELWEDKLGEQNEYGIAMVVLGRLHTEQIRYPRPKSLYSEQGAAPMGSNGNLQTIFLNISAVDDTYTIAAYKQMALVSVVLASH